MIGHYGGQWDGADNAHHTCDRCGKHSYLSRRAAKRAGKRVARQLGKQAERGPITGYACPHYPYIFHWGHDSSRLNSAVADNRRNQRHLIAAMLSAPRKEAHDHVDEP